ncbi:phage portal protein [Eubacterium ventriosum]|uniref:Phage portal protein n=1 Tax=Eubacterium ventriosum TaxID=39496 RepID=A0A415L423_9FIRM|nr:phage portal protein [Eubacterium ventriosum]RHL43270.1 phage portal protein [Eubacterium ventriosum]
MDLVRMKELLSQYMPGHAIYMVKCDIADRYYRNQSDILHGEEKKDEEGHPLRNADNRIPRNFHGLIVNQKAAYAFTTPPTFDIGSSKANAEILKALGDEYRKECMELCVNAANAGVAWVHYWTNAENEFEWAVIESKQIVPIWNKSAKQKLIGALRVYTEIDETDGKSYTIYEYWNKEECQVYRRLQADVGYDNLTDYAIFENPTTGELVSEYSHGMEEIPFIPFFNNNIKSSDLDNIKPLIDVYDKVFSGFINDLEDVQELIFVLSGYGGTDLNGFLQDLKKYKVIKMDSDEGAGVSTLNIEIPIEARNSVLDATRKAIFEQGQGFDPRPENFGNQSGEALKFMYSLLEMKTGLMETEFQLGFAKLVRAICNFKNIKCDNIVQTWTRTCIKNEQEQAAICKDSVGIISQKTILKNHPFVEDVEAELKQLKKENEEKTQNADIYQQMFTKKSNEDDDNVDDSAKDDDNSVGGVDEE